MSIVDVMFESARRHLDSPYILWSCVYHGADNYPQDAKLQCLYIFLEEIFLACHENRFDDLKKADAEEYVFINNDSDAGTILNALDSIEERINTIMSGG